VKKPTTIPDKMLVVVDISGAGVEDTGAGVFLEFEMLDGQIVPFQFTRRTADKLASSVQRLVFEAGQKARQRDPMSDAGAISIKSSQMSFRLDPDGSKGQILIRGINGPPLSIEVLPEDFHGLRDQLDNIEKLMAAKRKPRQN